jgi:hypothetical protein
MTAKFVRYSTAILRCPTGVFTIRGSVPVPLVDKVWSTEQEVIDALLAIGWTEFQLSDCSWYAS